LEGLSAGCGLCLHVDQDNMPKRQWGIGRQSETCRSDEPGAFTEFAKPVASGGTVPAFAFEIRHTSRSGNSSVPQQPGMSSLDTRADVREGGPDGSRKGSLSFIRQRGGRLRATRKVSSAGRSSSLTVTNFGFEGHQGSATGGDLEGSSTPHLATISGYTVQRQTRRRDCSIDMPNAGNNAVIQEQSWAPRYEGGARHAERPRAGALYGGEVSGNPGRTACC